MKSFKKHTEKGVPPHIREVQPLAWCGSPLRICDLCQGLINDTFIDGLTVGGIWGILCPECHARFGRGLGIGLGHLYRRSQSGDWVKCEAKSREEAARCQISDRFFCSVCKTWCADTTCITCSNQTVLPSVRGHMQCCEGEWSMAHEPRCLVDQALTETYTAISKLRIAVQISDLPLAYRIMARDEVRELIRSLQMLLSEIPFDDLPNTER